MLTPKSVFYVAYLTLKIKSVTINTKHFEEKKLKEASSRALSLLPAIRILYHNKLLEFSTTIVCQTLENSK